ncbi:MAG: hypothetical protein JO355_05915, partial [Planctomycetaceae bacterium]|nr:hypothetical protein [Planctomycetaceae bacterium]
RAMTNVVGDVLGAVLLDRLGAATGPEAVEEAGMGGGHPSEEPPLAALT